MGEAGSLVRSWQAFGIAALGIVAVTVLLAIGAIESSVGVPLLTFIVGGGAGQVSGVREGIRRANGGSNGTPGG